MARIIVLFIVVILAIISIAFYVMSNLFVGIGSGLVNMVTKIKRNLTKGDVE